MNVHVAFLKITSPMLDFWKYLISIFSAKQFFVCYLFAAFDNLGFGTKRPSLTVVWFLV